MNAPLHSHLGVWFKKNEKMTRPTSPIQAGEQRHIANLNMVLIQWPCVCPIVIYTVSATGEMLL